MTKSSMMMAFYGALAMIGVGLSAPAANAADLDSYRAEGAIGERNDGLAEALSSNPEVKALVEKVNAQRKTIYAQRAAQQGVTPDAVGQIYAAEIAEKAPKGTPLKLNGNWQKK